MIDYAKRVRYNISDYDCGKPVFDLLSKSRPAFAQSLFHRKAKQQPRPS